MTITKTDVNTAFAEYERLCHEFGAVPDGFRVGLDEGSKTYGRAFRVYLVGKPVVHELADGTSAITWPNGSGHSRPPFGGDYLGMTKAEAFDALVNRNSVLQDVLRHQRKGSAA